MRVLLSEKGKQLYGERIEALGYEVVTYTKEDIHNPNYRQNAEIVIGALSLSGFPWENIEGLQYLFLTSVGVDYLNRDVLEQKQITVTNAKGAYDDPIAEWIVYGLLQMEKFDRQNLKQQEQKIWKRRSYSGNIYGKTALFLGTGTIATQAALRLKPFRCQIVGYNTDGREVEGFDRCISHGELETGLSEADYVIMCLPDTEKTRHLINRSTIAKMKDGVKFVNISRGATVKEEDLIAALQQGKIAAAALDVFEVEPLPSTSPLWEMENVYVYSHLSFSSEDADERAISTVMYNLQALGEGRELKNIVNFQKGY